MVNKLLCISPEGNLPSECSRFLTNYSVTVVSTAADAYRAAADGQPGCVFVWKSEVEMAHEILDAMRQLDSSLPVVFWNDQISSADSVGLMRSGAYASLGYRDTMETLQEWLDRAIEHSRARREPLTDQSSWRKLLIGESRAMSAVIETIRLIGDRRCTVLITGETGTGKEMAARALHMAGQRAKHPFVAINCSALPANLLEAELFGHVKGAFTGAVNTRIGRFEQANKGTIFLDEIGDMALDLQAKLLRVLQDREIQRLGSSETIKVDVRVVAATNVDLQERVRQGKFREDLYYRLNVVPVEMPALRKRQSDVPLLVEHFIRKISRLENIPVKSVSAEAMERLVSAAWPGNVRQLENAVEMAIALSGERETLHASDFGLSSGSGLKRLSLEWETEIESADDPVNFDSAVAQFEKRMLDRALERTSGNKAAAAELLGLKRTTLIMKLRSFQTNMAYCPAR